MNSLAVAYTLVTENAMLSVLVSIQELRDNKDKVLFLVSGSKTLGLLHVLDK